VCSGWAATGTQSGTGGNGGVAAPGIFILGGVSPQSADELIALERFKQDRILILQGIDWEKTTISRAQVIETLAVAEYEAQLKLLRKVRDDLKVAANAAEQGRVNSFAKIKALLLKRNQILEKLEVLTRSYVPAQGKPANYSEAYQKLVKETRSIADEISAMKFLPGMDGMAANQPVSSEKITATTIEDLSTRVEQLSQESLRKLNRNSELRLRVLKLNEEIFKLMGYIRTKYDAWFSRYQFFDGSARMNQQRIEEGLLMMDFLRTRFHIEQSLPAQEGSVNLVTGNFEFETESAKQRAKRFSAETTFSAENVRLNATPPSVTAEKIQLTIKPSETSGEGAEVSTDLKMVWSDEELETNLSEYRQAKESVERWFSKRAEREVVGIGPDKPDSVTWGWRSFAIDLWFLERIVRQGNAEVALRRRRGFEVDRQIDAKIKAVLNSDASSKIHESFEQVLIYVKAWMARMDELQELMKPSTPLVNMMGLNQGND
jgi:hypothetical protein